jgi:deoxyadenosine/deoxycytidine kinase
MGLMTQRDYDNYLSLFKLMESVVSPPDLLIYLRSDVPSLVNKIQKRGRDYEEGIRIDYLKRLNERYEAFFDNYKHNHLVIQANEIDFHNNKSDLGYIIEKIDSNLGGIFKK